MEGHRLRYLNLLGVLLGLQRLQLHWRSWLGFIYTFAFFLAASIFSWGGTTPACPFAQSQNSLSPPQAAHSPLWPASAPQLARQGAVARAG